MTLQQHQCNVSTEWPQSAEAGVDKENTFPKAWGMTMALIDPLLLRLILDFQNCGCCMPFICSNVLDLPQGTVTTPHQLLFCHSLMILLNFERSYSETPCSCDFLLKGSLLSQFFFYLQMDSGCTLLHSQFILSIIRNFVLMLFSKIYLFIMVL